MACTRFLSNSKSKMMGPFKNLAVRSKGPRLGTKHCNTFPNLPSPTLSFVMIESLVNIAGMFGQRRSNYLLPSLPSTFLKFLPILSIIFSQFSAITDCFSVISCFFNNSFDFFLPLAFFCLFFLERELRLCVLPFRWKRKNQY